MCHRVEKEFGGYFGSRWFSGEWTPELKLLNIALLELYPICLAIKLWGKYLSNKCLQINSDNMAVVYIINSSTSKDPLIMTLLRIFVLDCMSYNILIRSTHLLGVLNKCSDLLSRGQVQKAQKMFPTLQATPETIPTEWSLGQLLKT